MNSKQESDRYTVKIRKDPLVIDGLAEPVPPPLFSGECDWRVSPQEGLFPHLLTGKLNLSINPTRFVRHQSIPAPLPEGLQKRLTLPAPPNGEQSLDGFDNWLPLSRRLQPRITSEKWMGQVSRYLKGIADAFQSELERVCDWERSPITRAPSYSVGSVETYFEFLSPDPILIVRDLEPHLKTFSRRIQRKRKYDTPENCQQADMVTLRVETAPGETLKIYAKTDRRIRIEIEHELRGANRFQFPREKDRAGKTHRSSGHVFTSREEVIQFCERLRRRAAEVVNSFLKHVASQAEIIPSHVSGYTALLHILDAVPRDYPNKLFLLALLIHSGCMSAHRNAPEHHRQVVKSLCDKGIVELVPKRRAYVVTEDYRHALKMLREHASFSILTKFIRERRRNFNPDSSEKESLRPKPQCRERRRPT